MLPPSPSRLKLANIPTPMRLLERVSAHLGGPRIWLKCDDLSGSVLSGNKIRKLEFLVAEALDTGCNTLITCGGLQSNHCRATAAVAAQLGLKCHLILRGPREEGSISSQSASAIGDTHSATSAGLPAPDGNLLLDHLCKARISVFPPRHYFTHLKNEFATLAAAYEGSGDKAYCIPTGGTNPMGLWGYLIAAQEMQEDFARLNINPAAVICASGSGGTQGGLSLGFHLLESSLQVVGVAVCDSAEYFKQQIESDVRQWQERFQPDSSRSVDSLSLLTLEDYMGPAYAVGYPELFECIRWLAGEEGVFLDPVYTGKAFYGMIQEIKSGRWRDAEDVVFVHTGGIFGLFPYRDQLFDA